MAILVLWATTFPAPAQTPAKQRMVVVISLDGFPAYDLEDPKLPVPTLRRLIREGAGAKRMTPVNPTVTWPNHTSLMTGVLPPDHGLLFNGSLVRTDAPPHVKIDPWIPKETMVHAVTLYDLAHKSGLTTAQMDWVAISHAPTITWEFPEVALPADPLVREMVEHKIISVADADQFSKANILRRDQIWTEAATYVIREHKPNLLLLHLLSLDSTHHTYGPRTLAANGAIAFLDSCVARVLDAIRAARMEERATVVVVSDHGFKAYDRQIRPAVALTAAGLPDGVDVIPEGGSAMLYVNKQRAAELIPRVRRAFEGVEGIAQIAGSADFAALGLPSPAKDPQMADIVLFAKSGYTFVQGGTPDGPVVVPARQTGGSHGYLAGDPEMDAIFIASGYGIRPGVALDRIRNIDVAPTLAKLLGVQFPRTDGAAVDAILR